MTATAPPIMAPRPKRRGVGRAFEEMVGVCAGERSTAAGLTGARTSGAGAVTSWRSIPAFARRIWIFPASASRWGSSGGATASSQCTGLM
jgi:hypothetical protein